MPIQSLRIHLPAARLGALAGIVVWLAVSAGCAVPIRLAALNQEVPRTAIPLAIAASLDTMADPKIERQVRQLLQNPELRAIEQELVAGLVDGTLTTLSDSERSQRIGALLTRAMTGALRGAAGELTPGIAEATRSAVGGALDAALSPGSQQALENLVGRLVAMSIRSAIAGLRDAELGMQVSVALTEQLGPALHKSLREDLAPGLAELLRNEELNIAAGALARRLGREVVLGSAEGLAQTQAPKGDGSLLSRLSELAHQGVRLVNSAVGLLFLVIAALLAWSLKLWAQGRRYREEAERRAAMARLLAEATRAAAGKPWSGELIDALQERLRAEEEAIAELRGSRRAAARKPKIDHPPAAPGRSHPAPA